jgi:hypothetical protein
MFSDTINWFRGLLDAPSAEAIALRELEECKRELLNAHSSREYAHAMSEYYQTKITRLNAYLHDVTGEPK